MAIHFASYFSCCQAQPSDPTGSCSEWMVWRQVLIAG
ncbi:hypothetical protein HDE80_002866 [Rhodanobacter sp. A1T4]|nr:hypothetical protein [Rhodanobacter sp. A1T4]